MKNRKWNREFPAVPQSVHQSVLDTLASLDVQEAKKVKKKKMKKRTVILLAAAMVAVLGVTAAAAGVFQWHDRAEEVFEAEPAVQEKLVMEEVAQPAYQTVSDSGLTVSAIQTIQDGNCFYALFEVAAETEGFWNGKRIRHGLYHGLCRKRESFQRPQLRVFPKRGGAFCEQIL